MATDAHGFLELDVMSDVAIEMNGVRKAFGRQNVLTEVELRVPKGKTYAFLGRNGAGKTTTIRMLMGLIKSLSA